MSEIIYFQVENGDPSKATIKIGQTLWVRKYNESEDDYMMVPITVLKIYSDGSWDGEFMEGEA
jgi:hypothetical protein